MKKILIVLVLAVVLVTGTAFAAYPEGWGLGPQFGSTGDFQGSGTNSSAALALKAPQLPIWWAISFNLDTHIGFGLGVSGDYYLFHQPIVSDIGLYWYLGLGGGIGIQTYKHWDDELWSHIWFRVPVGISWNPIPLIDVYLQLVPQVGGLILPEPDFIHSGWVGNIGIRFWL